jgi:hypothetical protein
MLSEGMVLQGIIAAGFLATAVAAFALAQRRFREKKRTRQGINTAAGGGRLQRSWSGELANASCAAFAFPCTVTRQARGLFM